MRRRVTNLGGEIHRMLSKEDNDILTQVGPGTPMGDLMRQYWIPALMTDRAADAGLPAGAPAPAGREPHRLPDDVRRGRHHPERLPAPRRLDVLRPQRGRRPALRLPRLEVRRRPAPASTCRLSRPNRTSRTRCARVAYPTRGAQRRHLGLHGPARDAAAAAGPRAEHAARRPRRRSSCATAPGCSRSKATSTRRTSASCTSATSRLRTSSRAPWTTTR